MEIFQLIWSFVPECVFCLFLPLFFPFAIIFFLSLSSYKRFWTENLYHSVFSNFLEWFIFQMHFLLFASALFLGFMWFDHVGWEISWSSLFWVFKSQIQLMVWVENDPHFSVAGTWGSVLLARLLLMFLVFVCGSHFFYQKKEKTDSTSGCEMCYCTYESSSAVQEVIDFTTHRAVCHKKLTSVDCFWLPAGFALHSEFVWFYGCMLRSHICVESQIWDPQLDPQGVKFWLVNCW